MLCFRVIVVVSLCHTEVLAMMFCVSNRMPVFPYFCLVFFLMLCCFRKTWCVGYVCRVCFFAYFSCMFNLFLCETSDYVRFVLALGFQMFCHCLCRWIIYISKCIYIYIQREIHKYVILHPMQPSNTNVNEAPMKVGWGEERCNLEVKGVQPISSQTWC